MKDLTLYINGMFGKKLFLITHVNIILMVILHLFIARVFTSNYIQIENSEAFRIDYLYQGIMFIKFSILIIIIVLIQRTKSMTGILMLKSIEQTRTKAICLYVISGVIIVITIMTIYYVVFLLVGYYLTLYFYYDFFVILYIRLILFTVYYYVLFSMLYFIYDSIYISLSIFILYLFNLMMTGFMVSKTEIIFVNQLSHLNVSDLVLFDDLTYSFLYSDVYQLALIFGVFFVLVWRYNKIDLL